MVWSVIPPVFDDHNKYFYFLVTNDAGDNDFGDSTCEIFNMESFTQEATFEIEDYKIASFSPAYYDKYAYYHVSSRILRIDTTGSGADDAFYKSKNIEYSTQNLNSTIAISVNEEKLFVVGNDICQIDLKSGDEGWCQEMNGGSNQGVTPAVDDDYVYVYDDGYIKTYDITNGMARMTFPKSKEKLLNACRLQYGCLSSQPIVTKYNLFWGDGSNVYVFDKSDGKQVLKIENICGSTYYDYGNSIAWYDKYIIVSCFDKIVMYEFEN